MTSEMMRVARTTNLLLLGIFFVASALEAFGGKWQEATYFILVAIFWGLGIMSNRRDTREL